MKGVLVMAGAFLLPAPAMTWQQADQEKPCAAGKKRGQGCLKKQLEKKAGKKRRGDRWICFCHILRTG